MKRHIIAPFVTLLALVLLAGTVVAEDKDNDRPKRDGQKQAKRRHGGRKLPDIGLTDAQKAEIEGIRKEAMAKIKDAEPKERRAIFEKMKKDIHGVFTEEQLEKLKKLKKDGPKHKRPDLGLSDEQKEKMDAIRKGVKEKLKDATGEERKAIMEQMKKDIAAILTEEQLEKLKKAHHKGGGHKRPDIGLTDEQKEKIDAIRKAAREKSKDATAEERKAIREQARKDIGAILTDEQREKMKKAHQGKGKRPHGRKGKDGDGKGRKRGGDDKKPDTDE
jgi:Spy/CpxP family protein refolding chaperone